MRLERLAAGVGYILLTVVMTALGVCAWLINTVLDWKQGAKTTSSTAVSPRKTVVDRHLTIHGR